MLVLLVFSFPFSICLTSLRIKDRMSFRWDQVGRPGESCPHGRLSLEDRRNLTWQPVSRPSIRLLQKGRGGGQGIPWDFFVTRVAEIGPISLFWSMFECLMAFLALGHLTQGLKSISEYFCVSRRPLGTVADGRGLISWQLYSSPGRQVFVGQSHHVFLWWMLRRSRTQEMYASRVHFFSVLPIIS